MTTTCAKGHESTWPDWCSICGDRIGDGDQAIPQEVTADMNDEVGAAAAATPAAASGPTCSNCGVPRNEHDVFCESCGYDFASGSLPEGSVSTPDGDEAAAPNALPMHVKISVDADFFANSIGEVDLTLPDPLPDTQIVPLAGSRILIGRQSTSRGIFPEIDVRALTDDPAVSSRHAMFERSPEGEWTMTDLGSTNGTFLTVTADDEVAAGTALPVTAGAVIYVGAWTRIELAESSA